MSFSIPAILMFCCPHQYINEEQQTIKKGPQAIKKMSLLILQKKQLENLLCFSFLNNSH